MKNMIRKGGALNNVLAADTAPGAVVVMQDVAGIAIVGGKTGDVAAIQMEGIFSLPKGSGALAQGKKVYWDATASQVVTAATGNVQLGYVADAAITTDTAVNVLLMPA